MDWNEYHIIPKEYLKYVYKQHTSKCKKEPRYNMLTNGQMLLNNGMLKIAVNNK